MTLTGVGGAGKTRLALRVAEEAVPDLAEDIGWVELAPLADARLVAQSLCSSLEIRLSAEVPPREVLVERLRSGRWLVVLDNCEHITDACADLVALLLDQCPNLRILATSREALGVSGEALWPVGPLPVPDERTVHESEVDRAMEFPSVQLFLDRARAVGPDFDVTPDNVGAIVRLCQRLEGIPLALELAAARTTILTVDQISRRLDDGLAPLRSGGHGTPSRHQTMRTALEWSHDLLSEPERILFSRLAAFGGEADIDACEAVCPGGPVESGVILELLTSLCEKSLVVVNVGDDVARYRFLEPVRHFAVEQLDASGERNEVCLRHSAYFLEFARSLSPDLHGAGRAAAAKRLEAEHDNLRYAWNHAVATGDVRTLEGLVRALFWFWQFGGHFSEGRMRAEEALDKLEASEATIPAVLHAAGALAWIQGDYAVAEQRLASCVDICERERYQGLLGIALRELAGVHLAVGKLDEATSLYERSAGCLRETGKRWDLALAMLVLADAREALGDPGAAAPAREEARQLFGKAKDPWGLSLVHFGTGVAAARAGDFEQARIQARQALALQEDEADYWSIGQTQALLGEIENRAGSTDHAAAHFRASIRAFQKAGDRTSLVYVIQCLAECDRRRGRTLRAARLAGAAWAHGEVLEGTYPYALTGEAERTETLEALKRASGEDAFAEEWAAGRALDFEEMAQLALADSAEPGIDTRDTGDAPAAALRVFALGSPEVYRGKRRLRAPDWTFALPRELLFFLLVNGPLTKERIGLEFWPDVSEAQLRGRFRTALYQLRRALGGTEWVLYRNDRYEFNRALDYWFDVEAFENQLDDAARVIDADTSAAADRLERAIKLYQGEFLEGESPGEWAQELRDRLRRRYFDALLTLGRLYTGRDAHAAAADIYRRAVNFDNLSEQAYRELARSLAVEGDRAGALRCVDELADILRRELDVEPSPETLALRAELQRKTDP